VPDCSAKHLFVQTNWLGTTNDMTCFRQTRIYHVLPPLLSECNNILTPYGQHQLNKAKHDQWINYQGWQAIVRDNPNSHTEKPSST
jgi:hypothetical protein